jgi:hypothetical protein
MTDDRIAPYPTFIERIDWKLLREQKADVHLMAEGPSVSSHERESLHGVLHLLDALMDYAADTLELPGVFDD